MMRGVARARGRCSAKRRALVAAVVVVASASEVVALEELVAKGDLAWERRAEGHEGALASAAPIEAAVAAYEQALEVDSGNLEARWKLMRALFFLGEHVVTDRERQLEIFERGRDLGSDGLDRLGGSKELLALEPTELRARLGDSRTAAAEIFFWSAVHWGLWGRTRGKFASAREGVAGKISDRALASIALDPTIENGGGHRVLGRLHTEAPKIPFITGWIDRETAVRELEACLEVAPDDLTTRLYLGEALIEFDPARRAEGVTILRDIVERKPQPGWLVEELSAIEDARRLLDRVDS